MQTTHADEHLDDVLLVATREVAVGEAITYDREAIMRRGETRM
jgi:hypothetical protein